MHWLSSPEFILRAGLVLVIALYIRTLAFDFVFDDLTIQVSPWIQSWHSIFDVFHSDIFGDSGKVGSSYYRPLASAYLVVVARLTAVTPAWFHLFAIFGEVIAYVLSYLFGRLLFEDDTVAAVTTLLFALHPTKIETIAWIGSSACDGQAGIYFFALLFCYLKWWKSRNMGWLAGSVALFLAAMFTKETMVIVPGLIAVHCFLRSVPDARWRKTCAVIAPYLAVVGVYALARHAVLRPLPQASIAIQPTITRVNVWSAPLAFWWYVKELVLPFGLSILHDWVPVTAASSLRFLLPFAALMLAAVVLALASIRIKSWQIPFFTTWFVLTLAPVIAFSPSLTVHDRYLQLAAYPFCGLIAYWLVRTARTSELRRIVAIGFGVMLVGLWSASTWREVGYWDNSLSLWQRAVQVAPHSVNARVELARLYSANDIPAAVAVLDDGLKLLPGSPGLWRTRGLLQFNAGDLDAARSSMLRAIQVSERFTHAPNEPSDVKYGRASAAFILGAIEMEKGNVAAADPWLRMAVSIQPDNPEYLNAMISNLRRLGRDGEAQKYEREIDPGSNTGIRQ